jgi:hypothetical protein
MEGFQGCPSLLDEFPLPGARARGCWLRDGERSESLDRLRKEGP